MKEQTRYTVDCIGPLDWQIFDHKLGQSPTVFLLYAVPIQTAYLNCQIVLTVFDGVEALNNGRPTLEHELWSTRLYVESEEQIGYVLADICDTLDEMEISDPIELAYLYGGSVGSEPIVCPVRSDTH